MRQKGNDYTISSVVRALRLIKMFDENDKQMSLTELSNKCGLPKSSVLRVLASCEAEGFIRHDEATRKYKLSIEIFKLANSAYEFIDLRDIAVPHIKQAVEESGLIGHFGTIYDDQVTIISKIFPGKAADSSLMLRAQIGGVVPAHCTGVGKVLTAFCDEAQREAIIAACDFHPYTANTVTDAAQYRAILDKVRRYGYATNCEEHEPYVKCITYPIFDYRREIVGALSLTGLAQAYDKQMEETAHRVLRNTVERIMEQLD